MYKPEGWDAKKVLEDFGEITSFTKNTDLIEAGADAMLEGLKKEGEPRHFNCDSSCSHQKGYKVFIPEESNE